MSAEYEQLGVEIGQLVASKQRQYGDAAGRAGKIMAILYPEGVERHAYDDALLTVRVLDKLSRIAQRGADGRDLGGESPWQDIAGYGLLGWRKDRWREFDPRTAAAKMPSSTPWQAAAGATDADDDDDADDDHGDGDIDQAAFDEDWRERPVQVPAAAAAQLRETLAEIWPHADLGCEGSAEGGFLATCTCGLAAALLVLGAPL